MTLESNPLAHPKHWPTQNVKNFGYAARDERSEPKVPYGIR